MLKIDIQPARDIYDGEVRENNNGLRYIVLHAPARAAKGRVEVMILRCDSNIGDLRLHQVKKFSVQKVRRDQLMIPANEPCQS